MKILKVFVLASVIASVPACNKKKDEEGKMPPASTSTVGSAQPTPPPAGSAGSAEGSAAQAGSAVTPDANADYITFLGSHKEPKPDDPVEVKFDTFKVTKAKFDPKNLEGGTATVEIDLNSLHTPSDKRDKHLRSESYLDVSKFTTATVDVDNVKKKDDTHYTADANVKFHGVEKKYPVAFEVVDVKDGAVRIKSEQDFTRADFKVGKDQADKDEAVDNKLKIKMQLTLKNS
jgi:polyisoprenoid-binding protein YceI